MGVPHPAPPALLVLAVTIAPPIAWSAVAEALQAEWGRLAAETDEYEFDGFTDYYAQEMGVGLRKRLLAFRGPVRPESLASLKLAANQLEGRWRQAGGPRRVNLDPGYLTPGALILASTKPASHRICLRDGIYAEVTLRYDRGTYAPLAWTYPDFRQPMIREFLGRLRPAALALAHGAQENPEAAA
jgi:hypothetical protein